MTLDLIGLGSAIIDFAPIKLGVPLGEAKGFISNAGGAVSNIVVTASRLGLKTGFLGTVGDDEFGTFILSEFKREGVDVSRIKRVKDVATGIAFYSVDKNGERHYTFYRFPGYSDTESALRSKDIDPDYLKQSEAFHFSESPLRRETSRKAVFHALSLSRRFGLSVSYDPNVRLKLWRSKNDFIKVHEKILGLVDIFLSTADELILLTNTKKLEKAVQKILRKGAASIVIRGEDRYQVITANNELYIPVLKVKAVDTSGAGDAFDAGFLAGLQKKWPLEKAVQLGGATAAIKVLNAGTREGLPRLSEVLRFMERRKTSLESYTL